MRTLFSNFLEEKISASLAEDRMFILHQKEGRHPGEHIQVLFVNHEKTDVSWTDTHLTIHLQKSFDRLAKDYGNNSKSGIWIRQGREKIECSNRGAYRRICDVVSLARVLEELPTLISNEKNTVSEETANWLGAPDIAGAYRVALLVTNRLFEKTKSKLEMEQRGRYEWPVDFTVPRIEWKDSILPRPKEVGYW